MNTDDLRLEAMAAKACDSDLPINAARILAMLDVIDAARHLVAVRVADYTRMHAALAKLEHTP